MAEMFSRDSGVRVLENDNFIVLPHNIKNMRTHVIVSPETALLYSTLLWSGACFKFLYIPPSRTYSNSSLFPGAKCAYKHKPACSDLLTVLYLPSLVVGNIASHWSSSHIIYDIHAFYSALPTLGVVFNNARKSWHRYNNLDLS